MTTLSKVGFLVQFNTTFLSKVGSSVRLIFTKQNDSHFVGNNITTLSKVGSLVHFITTFLSKGWISSSVVFHKTIR